MSIEAMKLALEAMEYADACLKKQLTTKTKHEYAQDLLLEAGTALRQAIEQAQKQKPVAWLQFRDNESPVVAPRNLGAPVYLGIRGGLAHDAGEQK